MPIVQSKATTRSLRQIAPLVGLAALLAGLFVDASHQISKGNLGAFQTFYGAANAMRRGADPYAATRGIFAYIYPPLYAFLLQPLTLMPKPTAAHIMLAINAGCIFAALLLAARAMLGRLGANVNVASVGLVGLAAALIAVVPIHNELRGLETNSLLLLSFVLALHWLDRRPMLAGLALAAAINIKYLPIIVVPWLLLRRRYAAATATLLWTVALALLPAITLGIATDLAYLQFALGGLLHLAGVETADAVAQVHATDVDTSISVTSALARFAAIRGMSKLTAMILTAAVAAGWGMSFLLPYVRRRLPVLRWPDAAGQRKRPFDALLAIEWTALVTFAVAFSPNSQNRNLVLAIVPVALGVALMFTRISCASGVALAVVLALMFAALLLPLAAIGKPFTVWWLSTASSCWLLLGEYMAVSWIAISRLSFPDELRAESSFLGKIL